MSNDTKDKTPLSTRFLGSHTTDQWKQHAAEFHKEFVASHDQLRCRLHRKLVRQQYDDDSALTASRPSQEQLQRTFNALLIVAHVYDLLSNNIKDIRAADHHRRMQTAKFQWTPFKMILSTCDMVVRLLCDDWVTCSPDMLWPVAWHCFRAQYETICGDIDPDFELCCDFFYAWLQPKLLEQLPPYARPPMPSASYSKNQRDMQRLDVAIVTALDWKLPGDPNLCLNDKAVHYAYSNSVDYLSFNRAFALNTPKLMYTDCDSSMETKDGYLYAGKQDKQLESKVLWFDVAVQTYTTRRVHLGAALSSPVPSSAVPMLIHSPSPPLPLSELSASMSDASPMAQTCVGDSSSSSSSNSQAQDVMDTKDDDMDWACHELVEDTDDEGVDKRPPRCHQHAAKALRDSGRCLSLLLRSGAAMVFTTAAFGDFFVGVSQRCPQVVQRLKLLKQILACNGRPMPRRNERCDYDGVFGGTSSDATGEPLQKRRRLQ